MRSRIAGNHLDQAQSYPYYGSQPGGQQPAKASDWDKLMQFNNMVMPALSNILGSWIQGRYQAQSAATMAEAFKTMSPQQQQQVMAGVMTQQMLLKQGITPQGYNAQQAGNFNQAMGMLPPSMVQGATQGGMNMMMQGAGGNAQIQALISQQGAQFGVKTSWPSWLLPVLLVGGGVGAFFLYQAIAD